MGDSYADKIEKCRKRIAFFEENRSHRESRGIVGDQRIEETTWLDSDQLIAIERRRIAMLQRYASLEA